MAVSILAVAALAAGLLTGAGHALPGKAAATTPTKITVTATDFKFKLSKLSIPKAGTTVVFTVVNKGKVPHDFKIAGKKTKTIAAGKKATLTVKFAKKGRFRFLCTLPGHAQLGMKGTFAVAVKPVTTTSTSTTTTTTSTSTTTVTGPATTVTVNMYEYRFELIPATFPQGTVTFNIVNKGLEPHNFDITGTRQGAVIGPNQTETWTVGLARNTYNIVCDVPFHIDRGMVGQFVVS